jgi:hypothetical protein
VIVTKLCIDHLEVQMGVSYTNSWGAVCHLRVMRRDLKSGISWEELQAVKDEYLGPDAQAVEVYPRACDVVDELPMRHLWEVPSHVQTPNLASR